MRLGRKFDVVASLFHVMSYQVSNADLQAACGLTLKDSLEFQTNKPLGFDTWSAVFVASLSE